MKVLGVSRKGKYSLYEDNTMSMDRFLNIVILYVQLYLYYIYISQCFDMVIVS